MKNSFTEFDAVCMQEALNMAHIAMQHNEVPVGAVLVDNASSRIIAKGYNQPITAHDPTAHAEIVAMRQAAQIKNNYRLVDSTLYVTLEPCAMCAGAMLHARITRLVFATLDARAGAIMSAMDLFGAAAWNHKVECAHGLLAQESAQLLRDFFKARR